MSSMLRLWRSGCWYVVLLPSNPSLASLTPIPRSLSLSLSAGGAAQHLSELAHAAYSTNDAELFACTTLRRKDVALTDWSGTLERPAHFVAVDPMSRSIVVSIRGTYRWATAWVCLGR